MQPRLPGYDDGGNEGVAVCTSANRRHRMRMFHYRMKIKRRILVVDDQPDITRLLKRGLEHTDDYSVREENDPGAALAAAQEFQPHLILLDVMMPGMDGGELAALIRANPKLKAVPIVFLTAAITKDEVAEKEGRTGGWPILAKPFSIPEVVACLEQQLSG